MKKQLLFSVAAMTVAMLLTSCFGKVKSRPENTEATSEKTNLGLIFYDFKPKTIDGKELDLNQFRGKKVLIVNTASKCGFTPQYKDLETLHETHGDKVVILGFPSNDFAGQEPGTNEEIGAFCSKNYGVKFQMMDKVEVKGKNIAPLYSWLTDKNQNGWNDQAPSWNFCKYLINERGELVKFFGSSINPMGKEVLTAIEK